MEFELVKLQFKLFFNSSIGIKSLLARLIQNLQEDRLTKLIK